jgi:hypothetical protein
LREADFPVKLSRDADDTNKSATALIASIASTLTARMIARR